MLLPSFHCNMLVGIWGEKDIVLNDGVVHWWVVMYYGCYIINMHRIKMNRDDIQPNKIVFTIQRRYGIWMIVVVPTCELLFSTSAYGLYLPSHLSLLSVFTLCSEYFIKRLSKQYLLYYLDALRALRDSVDGQYS